MHVDENMLSSPFRRGPSFSWLQVQSKKEGKKTVTNRAAESNESS